MSVTYRNHNDPVRAFDQVTGQNVVPFPRRNPWPCEQGKEPPKFLQKDKSREDQ